MNNTQNQNNTRIDTVDALRGFALVGIVFAHTLAHYISGPRWEPWVEPTQVDVWIIWFKYTLVSSKFFSLFSFLFGMSFSIMMESAARRGLDFTKRFYWRIAILFVIGLFHAFIFKGDVVANYAILGCLLPFFYRLSNRTLCLMMAALFLGAGRFIYFTFFGSESLYSFDISFDEIKQSYTWVLMEGSILDVGLHNWKYSILWGDLNFQFSSYGRAYMTLGYFIAGLLVVRLGVAQNLDQYMPVIKRVCIATLCLAVPLYFLTVQGIEIRGGRSAYNSYLDVFWFNFWDMFNACVTFFYASGFTLLYLKFSKGILGYLAAYGRTALTSYITQSIIGAFIFYNWGLGYVSEMPNWKAFLVAIAIIVFQVYLANLWLKHFRFGPVEWLWRCLTWTKFIANRKSSETSTR